MTSIFVLRHGRTAWNEGGLMQGRRDVPLSAAGREEVRQWRLAPTWTRGARWVASPLARAMETAAIMGAPLGVTPLPEHALIEMDWGAWEGRTLDALRAEEGALFVANEQRGLDFRPPGGESPREVLARVGRWIDTLAGTDQPVIAVTHKGVLRALMVAATGWDMLGKAPVKLGAACAHAFTIDAGGTLHAERWNIPLATADRR